MWYLDTISDAGQPRSTYSRAIAILSSSSKTNLLISSLRHSKQSSSSLYTLSAFVFVFSLISLLVIAPKSVNFFQFKTLFPSRQMDVLMLSFPWPKPI